MAAAFALAAQVTAATDRQRRPRLLDTGAQVFDAAKTQDVSEADVVTALPHAFYPESSWRDDLAWGAAELALAGQALDDPRADAWLASGAHWATEYLATEAGQDTLNLYDTSAIAMADLVRAMRRPPTRRPRASRRRRCSTASGHSWMGPSPAPRRTPSAPASSTPGSTRRHTRSVSSRPRACTGC